MAQPGASENDNLRKELREKWVHEDHLINHRLTWLLTSQTILLGAYGLVNQRLSDWFFCPTESQLKHTVFLLNVIPWVGIAVSGFLLLGLVAAGRAMKIIRRQHRAIGGAPDVNKWTARLGLVAALPLPLVFMAAWGCIEHDQWGALGEARNTEPMAGSKSRIAVAPGLELCPQAALERWKAEQQKPESSKFDRQVLIEIYRKVEALPPSAP
ncbi:MAG: hypothetical protein QM756_44675 [Polyangiaceae bacterium]